ncbi:MAG: glycerophosphodiester phosphodiesterase [Elusimicrobia bacterium]|nr:glycerophosphodiester phosphodiesterase [Elusimicrobiota bacterium]
MKRIMTQALLGIVFVFSAAAGKTGHRPEVHGHRGARAVMPENTLPAFNEALRAGADVLEMDMIVAKDDVIVISHEQSVNPAICLDKDGKKIGKDILIRSLTLKEIREFDCGTLKNPGFPLQKPCPGEKIPTLEEVFQLVINSTHPAAKTVKFNIETKIKPEKPEASPSPDEFAKLVCDTAAKYDMTDRIILQSFDMRTLIAAKKINPAVRTALLTPEKCFDFIAALKSSGADILSPYFKNITKRAVASLHKKGYQVVPWTANRPKDWRKMLDYKVDGIITDDPEKLIAYLKNKKAR